MANDKIAPPVLASTSCEGIPEIRPQELHTLMLAPNWSGSKVRLIDVRMANEFKGELGHVTNSELVTLGPDLQKFLDDGDRKIPIVFICRSGARSGQATGYAVDIGYENVANLQGGMIQWNSEGLPVVK